MIRLTFSLFIFASISGCALPGTWVDYAIKNEDELQKLSDFEICKAYSTTRDVLVAYGGTPKKIKKELERRKLFTEREYELIRKRRVPIGANELMIIASWGIPEQINTTTTKYGVHKQWVYNLRSYIYTDDGIVTAISN